MKGGGGLWEVEERNGTIPYLYYFLSCYDKISYKMRFAFFPVYLISPRQKLQI